MRNQFDKPCHYCKAMVGAGQGNLWKFGKVWYVAHPECAQNAQAAAKKPKEDIRIEFPSRGATYYNKCYGVYQYDTWPMSSVLGGQERRTFLDQFDTLEEAREKYPDAEFQDHSCYRPLVMSDTPPDWFDPANAGEEW